MIVGSTHLTRWTSGAIKPGEERLSLTKSSGKPTITLSRRIETDALRRAPHLRVMFKEEFVKQARIISELLEVLEPVEYSFFRGQAEFSWSLEPSLARIKNPNNCYSMLLTGWLSMESYLIREFKRYSYPYLKDEPSNKYD